MRCVRTLFLAGSLLTAPFAYAAPLPVVCVEAAWCNIAAQIGGPAVQTQSLISTPGIDPHELTPTPSMARNMAHASVIVLNGATYDDWAVHFLLHQQRGLLRLKKRDGAQGIIRICSSI